MDKIQIDKDSILGKKRVKEDRKKGSESEKMLVRKG